MEFNDLGFGRDEYPSAENHRDGTTMTASTSGSQLRATAQDSTRRKSSGGNRRGGNNGVKLDDSSSVIENILSAIEHRGENGLQHHGGPLTNTEVVKLSMLCTQQLELSNRRNNGTINDGSILCQDLGFADVDADMMAQLVEHLEKHVALASQIDLIQSSYETIHKLKKGENVGCSSIDEVSSGTRCRVGDGHFVCRRLSAKTRIYRQININTVTNRYFVPTRSSLSGFERAKDRNYRGFFPTASRQQ